MTPTTSKPSASQGPRAVGGPEARAQAYQLLGEGLTVAEVARRLGVRRATVSGWKNSEEGREGIDAARAVVARSVGDALSGARTLLRGSVLEAVNALVAGLKAADPATQFRCACAILDRGGIPRVTEVHTEEEPLDLSGLTPEELDVFEALLSKVRAAPSSSRPTVRQLTEDT
jgi:transposase-like protein